METRQDAARVIQQDVMTVATLVRQAAAEKDAELTAAMLGSLLVLWMGRELGLISVVVKVAMKVDVQVAGEKAVLMEQREAAW